MFGNSILLETATPHHDQLTEHFEAKDDDQNIESSMEKLDFSGK